MPTVSPEQKRLMLAVDHGWKKPGGGGPSRAVAHDFVEADKKAGRTMNKEYQGRTAKYAQGGPVVGSNSIFLKAPENMRGTDGLSDSKEYGKGTSAKHFPPAPAVKGKSLAPVKPRK